MHGERIKMDYPTSKCPECGNECRIETTQGNLESDDLLTCTIVCNKCEKLFNKFQTYDWTEWIEGEYEED